MKITGKVCSEHGVSNFVDLNFNRKLARICMPHGQVDYLLKDTYATLLLYVDSSDNTGVRNITNNI